MAVTPYMELDLPVASQTPGPNFASLIVAAFEAIDSHNHTGSGEGRPIPSAGLNIDDDVEFNGYAPTEMRAAIFENQADAPSENLSIFFNEGEFWVKDTSGNEVQITENGQVKFSGSGGGFGGDYGAPGVNAIASYSDTTKTYSFDQDTGIKANIAAGKVAVTEPVSGGKAVTIQVPTGMVDNYPMILPPELPAATNLIHMEDDGTMGFAGFTETDFDTVEALATNASKSPHEMVNVGLSVNVPTAKTFDSPGEVDLTNNQVSIPSHLYGTTLSGVLTTTGTLPTGLSLATTYYIIKISSEIVAFATSVANALAGTKIDLSGAGSGVHTFTPTANSLCIHLKQADGSTDPSTGASSCRFGFKHTTESNGAVVEHLITSHLSIVIPATATLGFNTSLSEHVYVYAMNNSGTIVLGVSSCSLFGDTLFQSAGDTLDTGADNAAVLYTLEGPAGDVPNILIGDIRFGTITPGVWVTPVSVTVGRYFNEPDFSNPSADIIPKHNTVYYMNTQAADRTLTLPIAGLAIGYWFIVKKDTSGNDVILDPDGDDIEGSASDYTLSEDMGSRKVYYAGGSGWLIIGN